jgi:hypothetical protein
MGGMVTIVPVGTSSKSRKPNDGAATNDASEVLPGSVGRKGQESPLTRPVMG